VVIDLPNTPDLVVISFGDENHQGEEEDPEKDDPVEDQDIDEVGVEQQWEQEAEELMGEQQSQQEVDDAKSEASTSNFDSGEEPDDKYDRIMIHLGIVRWF